MKVFISWSGDLSKAVAEELRDWLPTIVQSLEPFISSQDVPVGGRGLNVLASKLQDCSFGIICLTQENKQGPWIHFEAGALSKVVDASRVVPLLLDVKVSDLTGPLVQFQAISIEDVDGLFSLIKALSEQSSPSIAETRLRRTFDAFWPDLQTKISQLKAAAGGEQKQDTRSEREILEEILLLSRNTERHVSRVITARTASEGPPPKVSAPDARERLTIGDVWDAIDSSGFQPVSVQGAMGTVYMEGPDGQTASFPNQGFMNWAIASNELLELLDSWGVRPVVSRKYPVPVDAVAGSAGMIKGGKHSGGSAEDA
jgi:hypothetical protein